MSRYTKFMKIVEEDNDRAIAYFKGNNELATIGYDKGQVIGLLGGRAWNAGHDITGTRWLCFTSYHHSEDYYIVDFIKKYGK